MKQRFLGIDRLCVVQDDTTEHEASQVDQMGEVYRQARSDVVALAGEDADHGLPGTSKTREFGQRLLIFEEFFL